MANILNANELRNGTVYVDSDETYSVLKYTHRKYGRGQATIRVKVKNLANGTISDKTYDSGAKLEEADVSKKSAQYLYRNKSNAYFMDTSSYTQFSLSTVDLKYEMGFLREGEKIVAVYLSDVPIGIELPKTVELSVVESTPAIAGDTVNNANKMVTLETGLQVSVPMFVKKGDILKVNTDTAEYVSRI